MKFTYIQKGFIVESNRKNPSYFSKLFDLSKWWKEQALYYGVSVQDPCCDDISPISQVQTFTDDGAISLDSPTSVFDSTAEALEITLADGYEGQKKFLYVSAGANDVVVTPVNLTGGTTITLANPEDYAELLFIAGSWLVTNASIGVTIA